jgi:cytochrome c553
MNRSVIAAVVALCTAASAGPPGAKPVGIESKGYAWNAQGGEKTLALAKKGNAKRGAAAWDVCSTCHGANGAGRTDGTFPQLAGQHATVLIKQLADIRAGVRDNPIMLPFANTLSDPQELADVAAYLHALKPAPDNGRGPGVEVDTGRRLYERDCAGCHGKLGEGDGEKFYPALAAQHYRYLLRQAVEIRNGTRRNANPEMVKVIKPWKDKELDAVADYLSRLQPAAPPAP